MLEIDSQTRILVEFTEAGKNLCERLRIAYPQSENGYCEISLVELSELYRILLMGDHNARITDLVSSRIMISDQVINEQSKTR